MSTKASDRIAVLDFIRGVAVLGILAVNIASMAGPTLAGLTPHYPAAASRADQWAFAAVMLLFEGKMRALFTMLFGASMALFIDRAEAAGREGAVLQARRLGWLLLFGYLHFLLLWPGDILFTYALLGFGALALSQREPRQLLWGAVAFFVLWHLVAGAITTSPIAPGPAEVELALRDHAKTEMAQLTAAYPEMIASRLTDDWLQPLDIAISSLGETLPLMLIGLALFRLELFSDGASSRWRRFAPAALAIGLTLTAGWVAWAWARGFAAIDGFRYVLYWSAIPHLLMALGYLWLLARLAPRAAQTRFGSALTAAGRMAFSNYIGTSLLMMGLFAGWSLGLAGRFGTAERLGFVLLGWVLMLGWSAPWLCRFRQGPLEWLWRSLTEGRLLPFTR